MTAEPAWEPIDSPTVDLLSLVATGPISTPTANDEWTVYCAALRAARDEHGVISPNRLRPLVRGKVAPQRVGAFCNAAQAAGLIEATGGWVISDDTEGRNAGRPAREYRWIGGDAA